MNIECVFATCREYVTQFIITQKKFLREKVHLEDKYCICIMKLQFEKKKKITLP